MTTLEDISRSYRDYLNQSALYESLILGGGMIEAGENIRSISEGLNEDVARYINKVTKSAKKVWTNFKSNVANKKDLDSIRKYKEDITSYNREFTLDSYKKCNTSIINSISILPFNYEVMKKDLDSNEEFIKKHYSRLLIGGKAKIREVMYDIAFTELSNQKCNRELLIKSYNFCMKDFFKLRSSIENDFKTINNSCKTIMSTLNTVSLANESVELYKFYLNMLSEDTISGANTDTTTSVEIKYNISPNTDTKTDDKLPKTSKISNRSYIKDINIYMKVSMDIIEYKMRILSSMFNSNKTVITKAMKRV